jgi:hypothetical protein
VKRRKGEAMVVGDLLGPALRDLGVPSARLTRKVEQAWARAADPAWGTRVRPQRLQGGVLVVGVESSSLRQELAQFHRERLLAVLRTALPEVPLIGIRFTADTGRAGPDPSADEGASA